MLTDKNILIIKYLSGNASAEESKKLMDWIQHDSANQEEFDRAETLWNASLNLKIEKDSNVELAWDEFKTLRETGTEIKLQKVENNWLKVAAAVALFLVTGALIKLFHTEPMHHSPILVSEVVKNADEENVFDEEDMYMDSLLVDSLDQELPTKRTKKRSKKIVFPQNNNVAMITISSGDSVEIFQLPDNSIVYLNANSKLEYPLNFNKTNRRVALIGEAYFEVRKDSGQFVVACENTIIRGKGTSFNVRSNNQDADVEVIVASGTVEFSGIGYKDFKKLTITEGESGYYNKAKSEIIKTKHQRKNYKWWQSGNLRAKIKAFFDRIFNKKK
jgi:ferric-dicitrate binding protein FerR (iron transport regulator)